MRKFVFVCIGLLLCASFLYAQDKVALSEMNLRLMTIGYGNAHANRSISSKPLSINGVEYKNGVGTHAESKINLSLQSKAIRFTAMVGVDDGGTSAASVIFRITADGKEVFKSPIMRKGDKARKIDVNLNGIDKLVLEVLPTNDGITGDHADWADAYFEMKEGKPVTLSDSKLINVTTNNVQLTLAVDKKGNLMQQYLGKKVGFDAVFKNGERKDQAYPTIQSSHEFVYWGEPALHAIHSNGHTSTMMKYLNHETSKINDNVTLTRINLKDPLYDFYLDIFYKAYSKENVIEQWTEIYHNEPDSVIIKNAASAALTLRANNYWLTQFTGDWMNEFNVDEYPLAVGSKVIENKWGITSSNGRQPHFMVTLNNEPTENEGEVIAGSLAWSGNFSLKFERATHGQLTIVSGMNPWSADYTLAREQKYTTPALIYTYTDKGKGQASRNLHRWALSYGIRDGYTPLRTIFNNWEATGMNTADNVIVPFLQPAYDLGFELFLLDDGWFGLPNKARVLGEWNTTPIMHPWGMKPIIEAANSIGIDFGLWVEMEMANPDATLVKRNPEYLLIEPDREPHLQRGQFVLDLSNPEVQDFCVEAFNMILEKNPGISFVKWDCNSPFHNPYSHYLGKKQQHLWYEYTLGLYSVFERCMEASPNLQMMLCSAGGGRCDYGAMRYFHEYWTSDNTTPLDRVFIQWGNSHIFPAKAQGAHVTHMGHQPFKFAFDVAMSGCLGMDADPTKMTEEEKEITTRSLDAYKIKLRPIVQFGDLYRLVSPYKTSRSVVSYVDADTKSKAVVFVYQVKDEEREEGEENENEGLIVKLQGLNPEQVYYVQEMNIDSFDSSACAENGHKLSGSNLMETGLHFNCKKKFDSATVYLAEDN